MPDELKSKPEEVDEAPKSKNANVKVNKSAKSNKRTNADDEGYEECVDISQSKLKKIAEGA